MLSYGFVKSFLQFFYAKKQLRCWKENKQSFLTTDRQEKNSKSRAAQVLNQNYNKKFMINPQEANGYTVTVATWMAAKKK